MLFDDSLFPERCLASLQEVTKWKENSGDNKSRAREGQPKRISIKMLGTCSTVIWDRLEMRSSSYPISTSKGELKLAWLNNLKFRRKIMLIKMLYLQFEVLTKWLFSSFCGKLFREMGFSWRPLFAWGALSNRLVSTSVCPGLDSETLGVQKRGRSVLLSSK